MEPSSSSRSSSGSGSKSKSNKSSKSSSSPSRVCKPQAALTSMGAHCRIKSITSSPPLLIGSAHATAIECMPIAVLPGALHAAGGVKPLKSSPSRCGGPSPCPDL